MNSHPTLAPKVIPFPKLPTDPGVIRQKTLGLLENDMLAFFNDQMAALTLILRLSAIESRDPKRYQQIYSLTDPCFQRKGV